MNTRPFSKYTEAELLSLNNDEVSDAIRLEAIERGIAVPISIPEHLHNIGFSGYTEDPSQGKVYALATRGTIDSVSIGFLTQEAAQRALEGAVVIRDQSYRGNNYVIDDSPPVIACVRLGVHRNESKLKKITEYSEDREAFDKLRDECVDVLTAAKQKKYDRDIDVARAAEYLRLAGGDESVARAFWVKLHPGREWPTQPAQ